MRETAITARRSPRYPWLVLTLATAVLLGTAASQQAPGALGPLMRSSLHLTRAEFGLLASTIWGGTLLATLPAGYLVDRFGERRTVPLGIGMLGVVLLLATTVGSYPILLALFCLAAIGAAVSAPGGLKAVVSWFPPWRRGVALGVRQSGSPLGGLVAAVLLPPIAVAYGWQWALRIATVLALVTAMGFALFYRDPERGPSRPPGHQEALAALLRNRRFLLVTFFGLILMGAIGTTSSYLALSLYDVRHVGAVAAAWMLGVYQLGGFVGRLGWGALSDRSQHSWLVMAAVAGVALLSSLAMVFLAHLPDLLTVAVVAFWLGASNNGWSGLYAMALADAVGLGIAATAMGLSLTVSEIGMLGFPPLFGLVADQAGYAAAWTVLAGWIALAIVAAVLLRAAGSKPAIHVLDQQTAPQSGGS